MLLDERKARFQAPGVSGKAALAHAVPQDIIVSSRRREIKVVGWTSMSSGRIMPRWYWLFLTTPKRILNMKRRDVDLQKSNVRCLTLSGVVNCW